MGVFEMVVVVTFIGCLTGVITTAINRKSSPNVDALGEIEEQDERLEGLEERVRVLEALITDASYDLKKQIDELERE
jgi:hypothetical protein